MEVFHHVWVSGSKDSGKETGAGLELDHHFFKVRGDVMEALPVMTVL